MKVIETNKEKHNVLIFTGAGISNPLGLPLTDGFNQIIDNNENLKFNDTFDSFLENSDDIESILSTLESFVRNETFIEALLDNTMTGTPHWTTCKNNLASSRNRAQTYIVNIQKSIFDLLEDYKAENAESLYLNLIQDLKVFFGESSCLTFFTANYDLTFEKALLNIANVLNIDEVNFGFKTQFGTSKFDINQKVVWNKDIPNYFKIHGSLDWHYDNDHICTKAGTNTKPSDTSLSPILYPGFKGRPTNEPFISLHNSLQKYLLSTNYVVMIGFAMRDPYINEIFESSMHINKELVIFYFNPINIDKLPNESSVNRFIEKFPDRFLHIKEGINLISDEIDTTLNLKKYYTIKNTELIVN